MKSSRRSNVAIDLMSCSLHIDRLRSFARSIRQPHLCVGRVIVCYKFVSNLVNKRYFIDLLNLKKKLLWSRSTFTYLSYNIYKYIT